MKAFLLAAGYGTRMRPLTDSIPKCLLPVKGVPILKIWLTLCEAYGIDEVLINIHAHAQAVQQFLNTVSNRIRVRVFEEPVLLGSAATLLKNRDWLGSESLFWVFYSDVLTNLDLRKMLTFHAAYCSTTTLGIYEVPDPRRCGVVAVDEKNIVRAFVEKPEQPSSNLAFSGIMLSDVSLLDIIPDRVPVDLAFDVLPKLVGRMAAYRISEYLLDIGTPENYEAAQVSWPGLVASKVSEVKVC